MDLVSRFHDIRLLNTALELAHHGKKAPYERLEFLGDRVIGMVVAEMLYTTYPTDAEGDLAKRFTALVREETLADIARDWGLPDMLITPEDSLRHNDSILADVCEAVIGALYLDSGWTAVTDMMLPTWRPLIATVDDIPVDAKSALQEFTQRNGGKLPSYTLISQSGTDHSPIFCVQATFGKKSAKGNGKTKKAAEQEAASNLMEKLKNG